MTIMADGIPRTHVRAGLGWAGQTITVEPALFSDPQDGGLNNHNGKPRGFWYEVEGDWRRWCEAEQWGEWDSVYDVVLGDENMFVISTVEELDAFHGEHAAPVCPGSSYLAPDWNQIGETYDGIEIAPYLWARRLDHLWYYGWDCASGVVWRPRGMTVTWRENSRPEYLTETETETRQEVSS